MVESVQATYKEFCIWVLRREYHASMAAARLQPWAVKLSAYLYSIEFLCTSAHSNADGLSRLPLSSISSETEPINYTLFNNTQL